MYRIMIVQSKRKDYGSLYQYMTTTVDGVTSPLELATKADLDTKVQKMLNDDGYAKEDFIIVQVIDYTVDATDYTDDETASDTADSGAASDTTGADASTGE